MISSSIRMVQRKLGINILLSLIIGITLFLGIVCVSTYDKIIEKVEPYKNILKMYGGAYFFDFGDFEIFLEQSEVRPDKICGVKESIVGTDNGSFRLLAYDENQGSYKIPLSEGVWYTEAEKSDYVNVVVTPNDLFKLGDIVHPADYMPDADKNLYLRICGVTADSFNYFDMCNHPEEGIQQLYYNYYADSPLCGSLMFMSVDDIDQYEGFLYLPFLILGFDNKKSEEYVDKHAFTYAKQLEMDKLRETTYKIINNKISEVLPLFVMIFIMTIICLISIISIETIWDLKAYATYFICGTSWRIVVGMNAIRSLVVFIFGLGFMSVISLLSRKFIVNQGLVVAVGSRQMLLMLGLMVIFCLAFCLAPLVVIGRKKPVDVFRNSAE